MTATITGTVAGYDWTLAPGADIATPHAALYGFAYDATYLDAEVNTAFTWAQLHSGGALGSPTLDLSPLLAYLNKPQPQMIRIVNMTQADIPPHVWTRNPSWAADGYGSAKIIGSWFPGFLDEWEAFIDALFSASLSFNGTSYTLANHPNLNMFQMQVVGGSGIGEPFMSGSQLLWYVDSARAVPLTPDIYARANREYLNLHGAVVPQAQRYHFIWCGKEVFCTAVGAGDPFTQSQWYAGARAAYLEDGPGLRSSTTITAPAAQGFGVRASGSSEEMERTDYWRDATAINADRQYRALDGATTLFTPFLTGARLDCQSEEFFGANKNASITLADSSPVLRYYAWLTWLHDLTGRRSGEWADGDDWGNVAANYPGYHAWYRNQIGRLPGTDNEAWAMLGKWGSDTTDASGAADQEMHALARGLDVLGLAATTLPPSITNVTAWNVTGCYGSTQVHPPYYQGRTLPSGGALGFAVDDRLLDPSLTYYLDVCVTYLADGSAFRLEYVDADGVTVLESPVIDSGSGNTRQTVTVALSGVRANGALSDGSDLRLVAVSGTPTIEFVRVIPLSSETPPPPPPNPLADLTLTVPGATTATVTFADGTTQTGPATGPVRVTVDP